jgi:ubiquinone/menaquinone biosynthesis C-methylase UbiE
MDLQYEIIKVLFKGRSYHAPLKDPQRILDIGTGTGKWAIEMGTRSSSPNMYMANSSRQSVPAG